MNEEQKEVYFDIYCKTCKFCKNKEIESPCDECLDKPTNENSHKPLYYEEAK